MRQQDLRTPARSAPPETAAVRYKRDDLPFLDGLRGLAALIVLFGHLSNAGYLDAFGAPFSGMEVYGVWLFFVLSAFLLSRQLTTQMLGGLRADDILVYFQRRLLRIYPLFAVYLLSLSVFTAISITYFGITPLHIFNFDLEVVGNHLLLREGRGVTWSISVEVYYYVLLPVITAVLLWFTRAHLALGCAAFAALFVGAVLVFDSPYWAASRIDTTSYIAIFLLGNFLGVFAILGARETGPASPLVRTTGLTCLALLSWMALALSIPSVLSLVVGGPIWSYTFHDDPLYQAIPWAAILAASLYGPAFLRQPFEWRWLRHVGTISFGVYLIHYPIMALVTASAVGAGLPGLAVVLVSTFALAQLSFHVIERPFLRLQPRRPLESVFGHPSAAKKP